MRFLKINLAELLLPGLFLAYTLTGSTGLTALENARGKAIEAITINTMPQDRTKSAVQETEALKKAGKTANETAGVLLSQYRSPSGETVKLLKQVGYTSSDIGKAVKEVYHLQPADAVKDLITAGFPGGDVGRTLRQEYKSLPDDAVKYLSEAKSSSGYIRESLTNGYGLSPTSADLLLIFLKLNMIDPDDEKHISDELYKAFAELRKAGYRAAEVARAQAELARARVMVQVLSLSPDKIAESLKMAGFPVEEIVEYLKSVGYSVQQAEAWIKEHYNLSEMDTIEALYSAFKNQMGVAPLKRRVFHLPGQEETV